jgi:hypothetical protein
MLFKTIEEFIEFVPVNKSLKLSTISRDIKRVERKYLIAYLGQAQYDDLDTAFNTGAGTLTTAQNKLMEYARDVVALFTTSQALPIIQVQISDAGVKSHDTDTEKNVPQWKFDTLNEEYCLKLGWQAVDEMMKFLQANAGVYTLWAADPLVNTLHKKYIINTATEFNQYYWINDSPTTFKALEPSMKNAQLLDFKGCPGDEMMTRILAEIESGTISADVQPLMKWLKPMFANLVIYRAIKELFITVRNDGIYTNNYKTTDNANNKERLAASAAQMQYSSDAWNQSCIYQKELLAYLQAEASASKYPEFFNSSLYVAPVVEEDTVDCCECGTCSTCDPKNKKFVRLA